MAVVLMWVFGGHGAALALTSGYFTNDTQIKPGLAVSLSSESNAEKSLVERARSSQPDKFIGVAVSMGDALLTVASTDSQVYVATEGEVEAYVLDLNGDITNGEKLTLSPVRGVMMKATEDSTNIVGVALEGFDGKTTESISVKDGDNTITSKLAKVKVNIDARVNKQNSNTGQSYFERLGKSLTNKNISELQVLSAFIIFLVLLVVEGSMMYGAISTAITALGRNPLSKKVIYRALLRSLVVAVVVLILGLGAIYLVLLI
jgi:hypothetical protein